MVVWSLGIYYTQVVVKASTIACLRPYVCLGALQGGDIQEQPNATASSGSSGE